MEIFKKTLLFTIVTLGFVFLIAEFFYSEHSFKNELDDWYRRGKKAVGF
jgi:hypothetical protein